MTLPFTIMIVTDEQPNLEGRLERALSRPTRVPVSVQLRVKKTPRPDLAKIALRVRELTRLRNVSLLINGRIDIALEVEADGVHLPQAGLSIALARALMPAKAVIGVSCHTRAELTSAAHEGATYALLSPIHWVEDKAPPLGIAGFGALARATPLPVLALGGIARQDVPTLRCAGAAGVAVMRSVMLAPDPALALAALCDAWEGQAA